MGKNSMIFCSLLIMALVGLSAWPAGAGVVEPVSSSSVSLPIETPIKVITLSEISTRTSQKGDKFEAVLSENITDGNRVIAERGSIVNGSITGSDPSGRVTGVATIWLQIEELTLVDGQIVPVETNRYTVYAEPSANRNTTTIIGIPVDRAGRHGNNAGQAGRHGNNAGKGTVARPVVIGGFTDSSKPKGTSALTTNSDHPAIVTIGTLIRFNLTAPLNIMLSND